MSGSSIADGTARSDDGKERPCDRAGQRAVDGEGQSECSTWSAWPSEVYECLETEGKSESEWESADGEVDNGADGEQQRARSRLGSPVAPSEDSERATGDDTRGEPDSEGTDDRSEGGREDAVAGGGVAAVPLVVPQRQTARAEQVDTEKLRWVVGAAPV